ncbi:reverse transcriptase domain-containing protein [Tanacetum coccineum]
MPKYAKFLKGFLTNKVRLEESCTITKNERCSAMLLNKLPSKEKDPGSFTIPCDIGQLHIKNALADLGASISLMPYTMYEKLGLGETKATRISLELADRYPEESRVPIILGIPFLATARAMIDVPPAEDDECYGIDDLDDTINTEAQELLQMSNNSDIGEPHTVYRSVNMPPPAEDDECYGIDDLDDTINAEAQELLASVDNSDLGEPIRRIDSVNTPYPVARETGEPNKVESEHLYSASANETDEKKPELKKLPHHLEYAYLHGDKSFPIIISSELFKKEKMLLLQILMEDDYKPVIQPQRRLNTKVQDVVKNEIVKVLDFRLIYPISDSSWVSSIHMVPKKGGMIVVLNDNNELIPSRTITGWRVILPNSDRTRRARKDTFTCPYETFAYRRMPFGLCKPPATFQRCMTAIFHDMVEDFMEVFMDEFLVFEGIVLGHKIYGAGIEVDRTKIDVIAKLPYLTNIKGVRSFLGHAGFYRRFIKDFSIISKPMTQLLMKDAKFDFFDDYKKAFNILKEKLTTAPIIISPNWNVPFELMCDASDFAVGAVLGQRIDGKVKPIYYASKTLNNAQEHFTTTEKELLAYLFRKQDAKPRLIRWLLLLQGFDIEIKDKKGQRTLLLIICRDLDLGAFTEEEIADKFPDEHLMILKTELKDDEPWYADYVNYIVGKLCPDNVMRRCIARSEILEILAHYHSGPTRGHHSASITRRKVYESGFFWPSIFKDAKDYMMRCDACQRSRNISSRSEMPQNNIQNGLLVVSDSGPAVTSNWAVCCTLNPPVLPPIPPEGVKVLAYHPQTNGQPEVTNRAIKCILERSVGYNPKNWSEKLNDALWAFRTAYKTPTRCTPFRLVYGKACHLPMEIEHKAYWALKQCNMDLTAAAKNRFMEHNELMELRDGAYENTRIYKERTKRWHDSRLRGDKNFKVGDKVLLFNSRFKMHPGKLKSRWYGPNVVKTVYPYGTVEITDKNRISSKVDGQRLKKYHDGHIDTEDKEVLEFEEDTTSLYGVFQFMDTAYWSPDLAAKKSTMLVKYLQSGNLEVLES